MKEELIDALTEMSYGELKALKVEQENNASLSRDDKDVRIVLLDNRIKNFKGDKDVIKEPVVDGRIADLVEKGWTPLEAQELLDIEDGKIKPEDSELIDCSSSDNPSKPVMNDAYVKGDVEGMTDKQKENHSYLYNDAVEDMKAKRAGLE